MAIVDAKKYVLLDKLHAQMVDLYTIKKTLSYQNDRKDQVM